MTTETIGLVILAAGAVALLSVAQATPGAAPLLRQLSGWGAVPLSLAIMTAGLLLMVQRFVKITWRWPMIVGVELLLTALLALTHLWWSGDDPLRWAQAGRGGGYLGWALSSLLHDSVGAGVGALLLIVMAGAGGYLILRPIWQWLIYYLLRALDWLRGEAPRFDPTAGRQLAALPAAPVWEQNPLPVPPKPQPTAKRPATVPPKVRTQPAPRSAPSTTVAASSAEASTAETAAPLRASPRPDVAAPGKAAEPAAPGRKPSVPARAAPPSPPPVVNTDGPPEPKLPPLSLLASDSTQRFGEATVREMANTIERTLAAFNVPAKVVNVNRGPTVTQFGVEPGFIERNGERYKVRVSKIERLSDDLALALAASSIRIEAPVPGRPYVGIEVPNPRSTLVTLRGVLESPEFQKIGSNLAVALGKDVSGAPVAADLGKMPHLLIAGATGAGKSVCINAIITSLLYKNTPDTVRFLMVDPKMVELPIYNGIPHLLAPVVTEVEDAVAMLTWATVQMDDRYRKFAEVGARNVASYNEKAAKRTDMTPLPMIVIIIDELADLMMSAPDDVERQICRLAQMARATGIHLVLATQRPSVDVVTGLIKANFPARIAFSVTTQIDSRVILDTPGAEKLLGRGDMLLMMSDSAKLRRVQGCYVSERETERVVAFWLKQAPPGDHKAPRPWAGLLEQREDDNELQEALAALQGRKRVSASLLQRQLRIGYPRAARLIEQLEAKGYVGPDEGGGRSRLVLLEQESEAADSVTDEEI
jgi:S-DNA-T family DNA segregation ATPase FtsK/SpoIIIE